MRAENPALLAKTTSKHYIVIVVKPCDQVPDGKVSDIKRDSIIPSSFINIIVIIIIIISYSYRR